MEHLFKDVVKDAIVMLEERGVEDASIDAWLLAESELGITKQKYYMNMAMTIDDSQFESYMSKVEMRKKRIPLQHITGMQEFMGLNFKVNSHVLIPRQDTELLVEKTIDAINRIRKEKNEEIRVLDMCTGSGCIGISLAKICDNIKVLCVDISQDALKIAKENALLNGVYEDRINFVCSNLFENVKDKYDVIVSNPPYIPTEVIKGLEVEVREHEPMLALDGSSDGLEFYRKITAEAKDFLEDNGYILYEIGHNQGKDVSWLLRNIMPCVKVYKDLAGNDRVVTSGKEEL